MSLTMTIFFLVCGWLAVAGAMLWGVMRVTRRHHHPQIQPQIKQSPVRPAAPGTSHKPAVHHA